MCRDTTLCRSECNDGSLLVSIFYLHLHIFEAQKCSNASLRVPKHVTAFFREVTALSNRLAIFFLFSTNSLWCACPAETPRNLARLISACHLFVRAFGFKFCNPNHLLRKLPNYAITLCSLDCGLRFVLWQLCASYFAIALGCKTKFRAPGSLLSGALRHFK